MSLHGYATYMYPPQWNKIYGFKAVDSVTAKTAINNEVIDQMNSLGMQNFVFESKMVTKNLKGLEQILVTAGGPG
jgi:hypothetical protein